MAIFITCQLWVVAISVSFRNVGLKKLIAEVGWRSQETPLGDWLGGMLAKGEGGKHTCTRSPRGTAPAPSPLK